MFRKKRYEFNIETLAYEVHKTPLKEVFSKGFVLFMLSIAAFIGYYLIYTQYFKLETPKTVLLKQQYADLRSKLEVLDKKYKQKSDILLELQLRDNNVYRPIFGMEEIPPEVRNAGFGGVNRYAHLDVLGNSTFLKGVETRMDVLYKKAFVQSRSYDEVSILAKRAGDMAKCVPAIAPVNLDNTRFSSYFGYRNDPFSGAQRMHQGIDLSGDRGESIYATGNGKVIEVAFSFFGYGNEIVIDHGFGYKTRYAHLYKALVKEGDYVMRGDEIGLMGNTGKSKGTHLHYEVIYRNARVNPLNFYNPDIKGEQYKELVRKNGKL